MFTLKNNGKIALQNNCNCLLEIHLCHLSSHSSRDTVPSNQHLHYAPLPTDPPPTLMPLLIRGPGWWEEGMSGAGPTHTHAPPRTHTHGTHTLVSVV